MREEESMVFDAPCVLLVYSPGYVLESHLFFINCSFKASFPFVIISHFKGSMKGLELGRYGERYGRVRREVGA